MVTAQRRTTAWTLSWLCVLVIVYASLYPFEDWRNQDIAPWSFVDAPWPKHFASFDVWSNVLGYAPLGFWLSLAALRSGTGRTVAFLLALLAACALSFAMESLQSFLPVRVPSSVDWLCNTLGGCLGGVLAIVLERRGWLYHWAQFRRNWFTPDASASLVLMALWPLALLFPVSVPLGLGQVLERLRGTLLQDFPAWQWLQNLPPDGFFQTLSPRMEMVCVALGLMVPALLGLSVVRSLNQRLQVVLAVVVMAVLANCLSAALTYGPEHIWFWLHPQVFGGLALGGLFSLLVIQLPSRKMLFLMLITQTLLLMWVNQLTTSTYFAQTVQTWEQGRFIRFHGLTQWLNWLWPWVVLVWGVVRLLMPKASPPSRT
jgi:VanZ family protein